MTRLRAILATSLIFPMAVFAQTIPGQSSEGIQLPEGFVDETFVSGLPGVVTAFDATSPGRIFISEKSGVVRVIANGQLLEEPFLDIEDIVNDRVDRGMLSVAVHPEFPVQPYVYVLYTYDPPELITNDLDGPGVLNGNGNRVARLARYTADAARDFNVAIESSELIVLGKNSTFDAIGDAQGRFDTTTPSCGPIGSPIEDCLPSDEITHTIGALRFAGDGSLYVTNGDGANYRNPSELSQMTYDLNSLRGKILRVDPQTGLGLADNPFYDGNPSSNQSRVVSYGLRNPYSMTLHPVTGIPYVGEVGEENWEEINGGIGKNFGWPCYEGGPQGNLRQADFAPFAFCTELYASNEAIEPPLTSWQHDGQGNAGIIGDFYLGTQFPEEYRGKLFYGDYIRGWLRYADVDVPGSVTDNEFATNVPPMTEIRVGEDGALYYASVATGEIRRIRFGDEPNSQTPTPTPTPTPAPTDPPEPTEPANPSGPGVVEGGVVSGQPVTVGFGSPLLLVLLMCSGWVRQKGSRRLQD